MALNGGYGLVWLTDDASAQLSNSVPVDDPARLAAQLRQSHESDDRPRDLDERDLHIPIGQML